MYSQEKLIATIAVLYELQKLQNKEKQKIIKKRTVNRRYWVKPLLIRRCELDIEAHLLNDVLWFDDEKDFSNISRLKVDEFEKILNLVCGSLKKADTCMRAAVPPRTKLAITLRYLATGETFKSLELLTRVSRSAIGLLIPVVLRAIYDALKAKYLKLPDSEDEWEKISDDFNSMWQFPHTIGALDGKHIRIRASSSSASQFYNVKGFLSIVLFGLVDAHGRFIFIDVGSSGKASDSTIYQDGFLYHALDNECLNIPEDTPLVPGRGSRVPYFFIGDNTFHLDKHLMKPYNSNLQLSMAQEMFNYRLCHARMAVECAFGRLSKRFNIFSRPIDVLPTTMDIIVMTCCVLHNYLTKTRTTSMSFEVVPDVLPETFSSIGQQETETDKYASRVRDELSRYLISDGKVPMGNIKKF